MGSFPAPLAEAARSEYFGIAQGEALDAQDLRGMAASRVRTDRFLLSWRSVEPTRDSTNWGPVDKVVGDLAAHGIRALPVLWGTPEWVLQGQSRPPLGSAFAEQAWRDFLHAVVARYGPGGSFWATRYPQRFGGGATPWPVQSWQIWNEPNVTRFFDPGQTVGHAARQYARLLSISHDAIKSQDPDASIVLAGLLRNANSLAWDFLNGLYTVPGFKGDFEIAALHPYAGDLGQFQRAIERFRGVMVHHGDGATPLWLTEFSWGSAAPDSEGINKGPTAQRQMLTGSLNLILRHRQAWNLQRIFWFLWRDPAPGSEYARLCSWCGSSGLVNWNRYGKPAYSAFRAFTAERRAPVASITSGPSQGSSIRDSTPSFSLASSEPGSSFACRVDARSFRACGSRPTRGEPLPDGPHVFSVKAIDAAGNESAAVSRSFRVDTVAPAVTLLSGPQSGSASSVRNPSFGFDSNEFVSGFQCQVDGGGFEGCGSPFTATGLADGSHTFQVKATDRAGNTGSTGSTWTVDTIAPSVTLSAGPANGSIISNRSPSFGFDSNEFGSSFQCRLDGGAPSPCSSPYAMSELSDGQHAFGVQATDAAGNRSYTLSARFTIDTVAPTVRIEGPRKVRTRRRKAAATFTVRTSEPSAVRCGINSRRLRPCWSRYRTPKLRAGTYTLKVKATDLVGNVGTKRKRFAIVRKDGAGARRR
jgi:hypothetical protein